MLIGKDGRVQVVHVGLSPNLEAELKQELESLVAGKDLVAEPKTASTQTAPAPRKTERRGRRDAAEIGIARLKLMHRAS